MGWQAQQHSVLPKKEQAQCRHHHKLEQALQKGATAVMSNGNSYKNNGLACWQGGTPVQSLLGHGAAHAHLLCLRAQGHAQPHERDGDQGQRVGGRKGGQQQHKQGDVQAPLLRAARGSKDATCDQAGCNLASAVAI